MMKHLIIFRSQKWMKVGRRAVGKECWKIMNSQRLR